MKSLFKAFAFTAILGAAFTACETDPCKDVVCGTEGNCVEGSCVCNAGFEKDTAMLCNAAFADKFVGSFGANDVCASDTYVYNITITKTGNDMVRINNFAGFGATEFVNATVAMESASATSARKLTVNFTDAAGRVFSGTGTMNAAGTSITVTYTVTFPDGDNDSCTTTLTKQ